MRESTIIHILEIIFWLTPSVQSCPCDWAFQHAKTFDCFWPFCLNVQLQLQLQNFKTNWEDIKICNYPITCHGNTGSIICVHQLSSFIALLYPAIGNNGHKSVQLNTAIVTVVGTISPFHKLLLKKSEFQGQVGYQLMNTNFCFLFLILAQSSHSEPDTHVHVYLPPKKGWKICMLKIVCNITWGGLNYETK